MARNELVTDEVSAIQKIGKRVALLENEDYNFKITFPRDLPLAEQVIDIRLGREKRCHLPVQIVLPVEPLGDRLNDEVAVSQGVHFQSA